MDSSDSFKSETTYGSNELPDLPEVINIADIPRGTSSPNPDFTITTGANFGRISPIWNTIEEASEEAVEAAESGEKSVSVIIIDSSTSGELGICLSLILNALCLFQFNLKVNFRT